MKSSHERGGYLKLVDVGDEVVEKSEESVVEVSLDSTSEEELEELSARLTEMGVVVMTGRQGMEVYVQTAVSDDYRAHHFTEGSRAAVVFGGIDKIVVRGESHGSLKVVKEVVAAIFHTARKPGIASEVPEYATREAMRNAGAGYAHLRPEIAVELGAMSKVTFSELG